MNRDIEQIVTHEVIPVLRAALKETTELRGAVQVLADGVDRLTGELAEGELLELTKLVARALRAFETPHNGGGKR
jgi:ATP phosphoribosyltransferase regulatory subunit HisZ